MTPRRLVPFSLAHSPPPTSHFPPERAELRNRGPL
jgi:hypothetical protein